MPSPLLPDLKISADLLNAQLPTRLEEHRFCQNGTNFDQAAVWLKASDTRVYLSASQPRNSLVENDSSGQNPPGIRYEVYTLPAGGGIAEPLPRPTYVYPATEEAGTTLTQAKEIFLATAKHLSKEKPKQ